MSAVSPTPEGELSPHEQIHRAFDDLRLTLMKIRLEGSPWWREEWSAAKLASDALNRTDAVSASLEDLLGGEW